MTTSEENGIAPDNASANAPGQEPSLLAQAQSQLEGLIGKSFPNPDKNDEDDPYYKYYKNLTFAYFDLNAKIYEAFEQENQQQFMRQALSAGIDEVAAQYPEVDDQYEALDEALSTLEMVKTTLFEGEVARHDRWKEAWKKALAEEEKRSPRKNPQRPTAADHIKALTGQVVQANNTVRTAREKARALRDELAPLNGQPSQQLTEEQRDERKRDRRRLEFSESEDLPGQIRENEQAFDQAVYALRQAMAARFKEIDRQLAQGGMSKPEKRELQREQATLQTQKKELAEREHQEMYTRISYQSALLEYLRERIPELRKELQRHRLAVLQENPALQQSKKQSEAREQVRKELRETEQEAAEQTVILWGRLTDFDQQKLRPQERTIIASIRIWEGLARRRDGWTHTRPTEFWNEQAQLRDRRKQLIQQLHTETQATPRENLEASLFDLMREEIAELAAESTLRQILVQPAAANVLGSNTQTIPKLAEALPSLFNDWLDALSFQRRRIQAEPANSEKAYELKDLQRRLVDVDRAMHKVQVLGQGNATMIELRAKLRDERAEVRVGLGQIAKTPEKTPQSTWTLSSFRSPFAREKNGKKLSDLFGEQLAFMKQWGKDFQQVLQQRKEIIHAFDGALSTEVKASQDDTIQAMRQEFVEHEIDKAWIARYRTSLLNSPETDDGKTDLQFKLDRKRLEERLDREKKRVDALREYLNKLPQGIHADKAPSAPALAEGPQPIAPSAKAAPQPSVVTFSSGSLANESVHAICLRIGTRQDKIEESASIAFLADVGGKVKGDAFFEDTASNSAIYHHEIGGGKHPEIIVVGFPQLEEGGRTPNEVRDEIKREAKRTRANVILEKRQNKYFEKAPLNVKPLEEAKAALSKRNSKDRHMQTPSGKGPKL